MILNVFRTLPTAATAVTGAAAGAAIFIEKPPVTTLDWLVVVAGAIGMVANTFHAQLMALRNQNGDQS